MESKMTQTVIAGPDRPTGSWACVTIDYEYYWIIQKPGKPKTVVIGKNAAYQTRTRLVFCPTDDKQAAICPETLLVVRQDKHGHFEAVLMTDLFVEFHSFTLIVSISFD
jgi:hypothetical protein